MKKLFLFLLLTLGSSSILLAQSQQDKLVIEELNSTEYNYAKENLGCTPNDILISIKSNIKNLYFTTDDNYASNVFYFQEREEYVFCHTNKAFWLTINSNNHISKRIHITAKKKKYAFKVLQTGMPKSSNRNESVSYRTIENRQHLSYLTVSDYGNAMGAKVYVDDKFVGQIPLYKHKVTVGEHKVRVEKRGYSTAQKEYNIISNKDKEVDLHISMSVYKQYHFKTKPDGADVIIDGERRGFTPILLSLSKGRHIVKFKKHGYFTEKKVINTNPKSNSEKVKRIYSILHKKVPFTIKSEETTYIHILRKQDTIYSGKAPVKLGLPKGKYKVTAYNRSGYKCFKGKVSHKKNKSITLPNYSKGTFTFLVGDYYLDQPALVTSEKKEELYNLFATGQFARFNIIPGLSTNVLKTSIFALSDNYKNSKFKYQVDNKSKEMKYPGYIPALSFLFLNGEFRVGLPILRQLDIAFLGTYTYYPKLTKYVPFSHISGKEIFYGVEIATRISSLNANIKFGTKKFQDVQYNFYTDANNSSTNDYSKSFHKVTANNLEQVVLSVGFTLGKKPSRGNNMLRLRKKPLLTNY